MSISVGVVVINLNQKKLVEDFIQELTAQRFRNFKLYLVDNGSDGSQQVDDIVEEYNWVIHLKTGKNLGFTGGNNIGIQAALEDGHDFIWIVNNDTRLDKDCLKNLVEYLVKHPGVGILGPKIFFENETNRIWFAGGRISWQRPFPYSVNTHVGERVLDQGQFDKTTEVDFITGASMLVRSEVMQKIGGFDNRYFAYFEDADLSLRIQQLGYKTVYYPKAKMWHIVGVFSGMTSPRSSYYQIRNSLLFVSEWGPWWSKILAYLNMIFMATKNLVKLFIPNKRKYAIAQLGAVKDFVFGNFGGPIDM